MDYEKEYKEICQQLIAAYNTTSFIEVRKAIEKIHPELKENEDERIRKRIIEILNRLPGYYWYGQKEKDDILAYLEKQKEPHYTKRNAVFDKCVENCDPGVMKNVSDEVDEMLQKEQNPERINITEMVAKYRITDEYVEGEYKGKPVNCMIRAYEQGIRDTLLKVKKQKLTEDTAVQKAFVNSKKDYTLEEKCDASDYADTILPISVTYGKNGEEYKLHKIIEAAFIAGQQKEQKVISLPKGGNSVMINKILNNLSLYRDVLKDSDYNEDYVKAEIEQCLYNEKWLKELNIEQKPAEWSEEDKHRLEQTINALGRNGYYVLVDWLQLLPERFNPQPKQEWSEEDEQYLLVCKNALNKYQHSDHWDANIISKWLEEKLKSPRPQPHWKPSEQEKGALRTAIHILTEERNFPKAASHLQAILDAFEGKESRKDCKPSEEQMRALKHFIGPSINGAIVGELYDELEKL